MNEHSVYPDWKKYLEANHPDGTEIYEIKFLNVDKQKSFAFNRVDQNQIDGLLNSLKGSYLRIMDQPWSSGGYQQKKLCDCIWIKAKQAYVVIVFWKPRKYKNAYLIPIKDFVKLKESWKRKSIREEELNQVVKPIVL